MKIMLTLVDIQNKLRIQYNNTQVNILKQFK